MASWQSCITGAAENTLPMVNTDNWLEEPPGGSVRKPLVHVFILEPPSSLDQISGPQDLVDLPPGTTHAT